MPALDIIGYLWSKRQHLDIDGLPDILELVADLQRGGLDCIRVDDVKVLGSPVGVSVQLIRKEPEEWYSLVHEIIVDSAVARTISMFEGDGE